MDTGIQEKGERFKLLAEDYLERDLVVYIKDIDDNFYFAKIVLVGERFLKIWCVGPAQREGQELTLEWLRIVKFEEARG